jgi:biotin-(acetyl-CoA carboxylase) ligase
MAREATIRGLTGAAGLDLPPAFQPVALREHQDAFREAIALAPEHGAGTLTWVRRFDSVEFALVLEPEEPLVSARRALYAAMSAVGDALLNYSPPEKPLDFSWPGTILFDGGIIGGARLAWPGEADENLPADWLVVGFMIRTVLPLKSGSGHVLDVTARQGTSLEAEGFDMLDQAELIASFARHFLVYLDLWQEKGFVPVGQNYLGRLPEEKGVKRGIDTNGDLLVRRLPDIKVVERQSLIEALAAPDWLDPETGEPWL